MDHVLHCFARFLEYHCTSTEKKMCICRNCPFVTMSDGFHYHRNEKIHFQSSLFGDKSNNSDLLNGSLVIGENKRRHFACQNSQPQEFKPGCKMVDHRDRCPDEVIIPTRRAQLHTLTFTTSDRYRDRRHLKESDLPSVKNPDQKDVHWTRKKVTHDDKQRPVSQFRSSEYNLEHNMTRKHRIQGTSQQRNEIPIASLGDKPFKISELSPGFFNEGGLISGSTMRPRPVKLLRGSKAEEETLGKSIKSLTAMEKRTQYINDSDKRQVDMLTNSQFKRGQEVPSWEEKTGMWLCRPDPEEDDD